MSLSLEELEHEDVPQAPQKYGGPTKYMEYEVAPWNHPTTLAKEILGNVAHWIVIGVQLTAPMGKGKTKFAACLAHHIHKLDERFSVRWAGPNEFKHIDRFLESLPKQQPVIIIFDDITSALKQMGDKEVHKNFNALTRIRHIIDPQQSKTPIVVITTGHYSKNLEKEFRNVLEYNGFAAWTNDEQTNLDAIAPKNTQARRELNKFIRIYRDISKGDADNKRFSLALGNGTFIEYNYKNIRPCCVVHGIEAKIILFDESDCCEKCSKLNVKKMVPCVDLYQKMFDAYGKFGRQALRMGLWRRGYYEILPRGLGLASQFLEDNVLSSMTVDWDEMAEYIFKVQKQPKPKNLYHKRKLENAILEELHDKLIEVEIEPESPVNTS
jgi:hypothetical protein